MSDRRGEDTEQALPPATAEITSYDVPLQSLVGTAVSPGSDTIVDAVSVVFDPNSASPENDPRSEPELPVARPSPEVGPLSVGDVVAGKYVVDEILGRGGMGQIVAARHRELGTTVAIKIVLPEALGSEATVGRFKREALAMASLRSEHAVRIIDVGDLDGKPYLIMEHLEGNDLAAELRRRGPLPVKEAITYVLEAADVLAEAHDIGIIHRDLKPGNLFLAWRPSKTRSIRVLDFGIAKPMVGAALAEDGHADLDSVDVLRAPTRPPRHVGKLTMAGATLGTPNFMAPEQVSSGAIGPHTDVWGIGATLYTLLTGALPFTGPSLSLICGAVCTLPPTPLRQHRPEIPREVEAVVLKCLAKQPAKRFLSIRELAAALEHASNVRAPATTTGLRAPRKHGDEDDEEHEEHDDDDDEAASDPRSAATSPTRLTGDARVGATVQIAALWDRRRSLDPRHLGIAAVVAVCLLVVLVAFVATNR